MAETSIPVQPTGVAPQGPAPAPTQLKMVQVSDVNGVVQMQAVVLFDEQGREVYIMTRDQGDQIIRLLTQLVNITSQSTGVGFLAADDTGFQKPET
jgi:hypothetical protein